MHSDTVVDTDVTAVDASSERKMHNNNFIVGMLPNQIKKFYGINRLIEKITSATSHQDDGCPCVDIEMDGLNRVDHWQWVKVKNGDYEGNNWVNQGSDTIETE